MKDEPTTEVKPEGLALLRAPFPPHQISKLPKGTKAQNECDKLQKRKCAVCGGFHHPDIIHLDYVGHAALTDRLLDVDPNWFWEPLALSAEGLPQFDKSGGLWIRLTVCGISRIGYGNAESKGYMDVGSREKEVIGDALRNAAMRFGAALDLWHKGDLHLDEDAPAKKSIDDPSRPNTATQVATDAFNELSPETKDFVYSHAKAIIGIFDSKGDLAAYIERENFDNETKLALWSQLPSNVRSAIKKQQAAKLTPADYASQA